MKDVTTAIKLKTTWIIMTTVVSYKADFIFSNHMLPHVETCFKGLLNPLISNL